MYNEDLQGVKINYSSFKFRYDVVWSSKYENSSFTTILPIPHSLRFGVWDFSLALCQYANYKPYLIHGIIEQRIVGQ